MEILRRVSRVVRPEVLRAGRQLGFGVLYLSSIFSQVHEDSYWDGNVFTLERFGYKLETTFDCRTESLGSLIEGRIERTNSVSYPDSILIILRYQPDPGELAKMSIPSDLFLPRDQLLGFWIVRPDGSDPRLLAELQFDCNSAKPYIPEP